MELKDYQMNVLDDLSEYLNALVTCKFDLKESFAHYWKNYSRFCLPNEIYKNNIPNVPHVCVKVPTAGGKTFIAVNALERIFNFEKSENNHRFSKDNYRFVVWLVPSLTILEQTVKSLSDIDHPYRQKLNVLFNGRVHVYEKSDVLHGAGFNADAVRGQLSILVMSFDSLKATNKENRKSFQENGVLDSSFGRLLNTVEPLENTDPSALINVIRCLNPVVIVDESHNAESSLSVEMLCNLNPAFILDLTATPRQNSNIISYVDAMPLRKQNMVKLPVIVANRNDQTDVINAALALRSKLELQAIEDEKKGAGYVRPIVLFQAEPKNKSDTTTFEKVKETLLSLNIPAEQIAIKTAAINELKDVNLMDRRCPVRYIITVNALKEGWDCPFAYILATLANKSSVVDVTQILGRILRMPYTRKSEFSLLTASYVFTASSQFQTTVANVVEGLNRSGFSKDEYRVVDNVDLVEVRSEKPVQATFNLTNDNSVASEKSVNVSEETPILDSEKEKEKEKEKIIDPIEKQATKLRRDFEEETKRLDNNDQPPTDLGDRVKKYSMVSKFLDSAKQIKLPQFFVKEEINNGFFESEEEWHQLTRENLLKSFSLVNKDATVNFAAVDLDASQIDIEDMGNGKSRVITSTLRENQKENLKSLIGTQSNEGQITSIIGLIFSTFGRNSFYPISDNDVKAYLKRIIQQMTAEQRSDCVERHFIYSKVIKEKIKALESEFAEKEFFVWLEQEKITARPSFSLQEYISPNEDAKQPIQKGLYSTESSMNGLETSVINILADLENVIWWHRNLERGKGFFINGFINHYPDFIVKTNKSVLLIEVKGDDRDNSDSRNKLKLGKRWASYANQISHATGFKYNYLMVFDNNSIEDALRINDLQNFVKYL